MRRCGGYFGSPRATTKQCIPLISLATIVNTEHANRILRLRLKEHTPLSDTQPVQSFTVGKALHVTLAVSP